MKRERETLCSRIACIADRFKHRFIETAIDLASEYPTQSPSWECALKGGRPGLVKVNFKECKVIPVHILIIEDEVSLADAMQELIKTVPNVFVKAVHSGEQALGTIPMGFWDIVFLDINLPDMNGLDLLEQVKDYMTETRFYIVSGYGFDHNKQRAMELGVAAFIDKPFDPEKLLEIVESVTSCCAP